MVTEFYKGWCSLSKAARFVPDFIEVHDGYLTFPEFQTHSAGILSVVRLLLECGAERKATGIA